MIILLTFFRFIDVFVWLFVCLTSLLQFVRLFNLVHVNYCDEESSHVVILFWFVLSSFFLSFIFLFFFVWHDLWSSRVSLTVL